MRNLSHFKSVATALLLMTVPVWAADLSPETGESLPQTRIVPATRSSQLPSTFTPNELNGIWGAIAFSPEENKHGIFWGGDKRRDAESAALEYCANAGGSDCSVVTVFRNYRHWNVNDGSGFPYHHCGALAVGPKSSGRVSWGAEAAATRKQAETGALQKCEAEGDVCEISEWVCT